MADRNQADRLMLESNSNSTCHLPKLGGPLGPPQDPVVFMHSTFSKGEPSKRYHTHASKRPFFSGESIVLGLSCPSRNLFVKPLLLPKASTPHPPDRTMFPLDCKVIATPRDGLSTQRVDDFEGVDSMVASNIEAAGGEVSTVARGLSWTLVNSQMMVSLLLLD
ncbi:hypothetical protein AMTR_s00057p00184520 [Amborella trichopoda]|uniref:Uncharacterized protein n=1 Tax=Amborella trichopoda TaxID=13333 RepID=U5D679_AMBTC|nr:hypothetical protein AMTR_s00057p00184520 [Amborella trichopoda]